MSDFNFNTRSSDHIKQPIIYKIDTLHFVILLKYFKIVSDSVKVTNTAIGFSLVTKILDSLKSTPWVIKFICELKLGCFRKTWVTCILESSKSYF